MGTVHSLVLVATSRKKWVARELDVMRRRPMDDQEGFRCRFRVIRGFSDR